MGNARTQTFIHLLLAFSPILQIGLGMQLQVLYNKLSGADVSIRCAVLGIRGSNYGVKSTDGSDACEMLPDDWSETTAAGFTFLKRKTTVKVFKEDEQVINDFIPGTFTVGSQYIIKFQIPLELNWTAIYMTFRTLITTLRFVRMIVFPSNKFWISQIDALDLFEQRGQFSVTYYTGVTYVATILAMNTQFKVTFDTPDTSHVHYLDYIFSAPPDQFCKFQIAPAQLPILKSLTFIKGD